MERMSPKRWNGLADVGTDDRRKMEWTCLVPHERLWKGLELANTQVAPVTKTRSTGQKRVGLVSLCEVTLYFPFREVTLHFHFFPRHTRASHGNMRERTKPLLRQEVVQATIQEAPK